jgi:aromatic-L-amino-acid/L-tryptophan decarboxylase
VTPFPLPEPVPDLELRGERLRALIDAAATRLIAHIDALGEMPASGLDRASEVAARWPVEPLPEGPGDLDAILDDVLARAEISLNAAGPGFVGYIPGGGLPHAAVADLLANALNRYVGVSAVAPALARLEANVVQWLVDIIGLPAGAFGALTSGGSLANLGALAAARTDRLGDDLRGGVFYCSDQTHHSIDKSARVAGLPASAVRRIATDDACRLRVDALEEALHHDRRRGLRPFLLIANAGTTNTGAIDPLPALADIAAREGLWYHIDAAYGGFFALTVRGRAALAGIERADSVVLDPHKTMFLPYGTGALLVRDPQRLQRAHIVDAEYLPARPTDPGAYDFADLSPELTRPFRGLRIWLAVKLHGIDVFRRALDEKLDLARWLAAELAALDTIDVLAPPPLSTFAFRLHSPHIAGDDADALNRAALDRINASRRVLLTGTTLRGRFTLRVSIVSFRTHADRMREARDIIADAAALTLADAAHEVARREPAGESSPG